MSQAAGPEVLIATADAGLLAPLKSEFSSLGFQLISHSEIDELCDAVKKLKPQFVIVDLDLAEQPPWDVLALLRLDPQTARLPVMLVSGKHTASRQVISGLRMGAVEYILKPCDPKVLAARVLALLNALERRRKLAPEGSFKTEDGRLVLDLKAHRCHAGDKEITLTRKEFAVLSTLLGKKNNLVAKEELLRHLWPASLKHTEENALTLAQHIAHLRRKLGPLKERLKTVWGMGYRFEE